MRDALIAAINALPEREQQVMSMRYEHDMTFAEIAAVLNVTEARISELHHESLSRLCEAASLEPLP